MTIHKMDFYEGAAFYRLIRTGNLTSVIHKPPLFVINETLEVLIKYSTKNRSPWQFTFTTEEQEIVKSRAERKAYAVMVCGSDGIPAVSFREMLTVMGESTKFLNVSCFRRHGQHYQVKGPKGALPGKISRTVWNQILG